MLAAATIVAAMTTPVAAATLPPAWSPGGPFVVASESLVVVPQGGVLRVDEIVTAASTGAARAATLPLPQGASDLALQPGGVPAAASPSGVRLSLPPRAETVHAVFSFVLAAAAPAAVLRVPVAYPTAYLFVLLPHGRWRVSGAGFAADGAQRLGPLSLDAYDTLTPTPGAVLGVTVSPASSWRTVLWRALLGAAIGLLAAGVAAAGVRARRRRRMRDALVEDAARLQLAFADGRVPEAQFRERQRDLLEHIEALGGG